MWHSSWPAAAGGAIGDGPHLRAPNGTPLADVMLGVLQALGLEDVQSLGDSEKPFNLKGTG